ncbi:MULTISPECIES: flavin monoamine oxidase family protein [Oxalobacteraceae]|uniref:Flavin monoamine oxidase family protein n=1 Tax=Herminiimonas aquatilis TaxID=345342 RepID=A0ABW2J6I0_9BURK|nr:FAD-dependent oxidoreductase [Janthinobacterium sp. Marseille]
MGNIRVGILGGGLSGLYAAYLLERHRVDYFVLEARTRLGGRILSNVDGSGRASAARFDLGATWYWPPLQPAMNNLIEQLGLRTLPQYDMGDIVLEHSRHQIPIRQAAAGLAEGSMRIAGGTATLVDRLAADLPREKLFLSHQAESIRLDSHRINIKAINGLAKPKTFDATHVLLAIPPRLMAQNLAFEPAIDRHLLQSWKGTNTWMASHAKFVAVYEQPFWRENGLSGMARSTVGPLVEIHDASDINKTAALFGFFGWQANSRRLLNEEALIAQCIAQLVRLFGHQAAQTRAKLFKDWAQDPMTATQADQFSFGHSDADSLKPKDIWADRLRLIGSEASTTFPGYLAGALEAAETGVQSLLSSHET